MWVQIGLNLETNKENMKKIQIFREKDEEIWVDDLILKFQRPCWIFDKNEKKKILENNVNLILGSSWDRARWVNMKIK